MIENVDLGQASAAKNDPSIELVYKTSFSVTDLETVQVIKYPSNPRKYIENQACNVFSDNGPEEDKETFFDAAVKIARIR